VFTINATHAETYDWYGPQGFIADNNLPELAIENVDYEDSGEYYCSVINSCGSETSSIVLLTVYEEQSVGVSAGWSGFSSWIDPFNPSVENIFEDVLDQLIIMKNFTNIYIPGYNINTIGNWDTQDAYEIKFTGLTEVSLFGFSNTNRTVELNTGWNYLPVVVACPVDIDEMFGNIAEVEVLKEIAGNGIYWPAMNINSIGELLPGNAYFIRVSTAIDLVFDDCEPGFKSSFASTAHRPENLTTWNEIYYTPSSHIFAISNEILDQLYVGDVIGAFTSDGTCAGMSEIMMQNNSLTLYGDDQLTEEADGFAENSSIQFRVYRPGTGEEFELNARFDQSFPNAEGVFVSNGLSRILDGEMNATSVIETSTNTINLYPNPTKGVVNISGIGEASSIDIYTTGGQVLETIEAGGNDANILSIDLSTYPGGIIYFRITTKDNVEIRKVILK
jgi:hypothetical protein